MFGIKLIPIFRVPVTTDMERILFTIFFFYRKLFDYSDFYGRILENCFISHLKAGVKAEIFPLRGLRIFRNFTKKEML